MRTHTHTITFLMTGSPNPCQTQHLFCPKKEGAREFSHHPQYREQGF